MLTYKVPQIYELAFKIPPALIWRKKSIKALVEAIHKLTPQPKKVLDMGCGTGILAPIIRKLFPTTEIIGIDKSQQMINFARMRYGTIAKFKTADFLDYNEPNELNKLYDLIIAFYSFEFFILREGVEKLKELLAPGGTVVIVTTTRAPFSILHQFFVSKFLRTQILLYSPARFFEFFTTKESHIQAKLISEIEGSYLLTITSSST